MKLAHTKLELTKIRCSCSLSRSPGKLVSHNPPANLLFSGSKSSTSGCRESMVHRALRGNYIIFQNRDFPAWNANDAAVGDGE